MRSAATSESATAAFTSVDAVLPRLGQQRRQQRAVLDHVRERLAGRHLAVESEERRPHGIVETAVGDRHVEDRLRALRDPSQTPMASNSRRAAATIADARGSLPPRSSAGSATIT